MSTDNKERWLFSFDEYYFNDDKEYPTKAEAIDGLEEEHE